MGLADADSAEHGVTAANMLIAPVVCPLPDRAAGGPKLSGRENLRIAAGTRLAAIYNMTGTSSEAHFCNYELNEAYTVRMAAAGLVFSAFGAHGEARACELPDRRFFIGTLFQPQLSSTADAPHPIVDAFLRAAIS